MCPGPFIRRPVGTSLLAIGLLLLGATAYFFLPVAPLPQVDFPTIGVSASLPGVDPATAASSLRRPARAASGPDRGVTEMTSVSSLGGSQHHRAIRFEPKRQRRGAGRAEPPCNAAARRPACQPPESAHLSQIQSRRFSGDGSCDDFAERCGCRKSTIWPIRSFRSDWPNCLESARSGVRRRQNRRACAGEPVRLSPQWE